MLTINDLVIWLKILILISCALFMSLVCLSNVFIYEVNFEYVQHIMRMDTTFGHPSYMKRSIESPLLHHACYIFVIIFEGLCATVCWVGVYKAIKYRKENQQFKQAKLWGTLGLSLSVLFYVLFFFVIGNEWFGSWQSQTWNAKRAAEPILIMLGICLIYFSQPEQNL